MLNELDHLAFIEVIEEALDVGIKHIVHLLLHQSPGQRVQRLMDADGACGYVSATATLPIWETGRDRKLAVKRVCLFLFGGTPMEPVRSSASPLITILQRV
jgi:hypothetical protein